MDRLKELQLKANNNRRKIVDLVYHGKAGHPGGALSIIDILTAIYSLDIDLSKEVRGRLVMSKGHAVAAQYACLHDQNIISDEEMKTFRTLDSRLQGHPSTSNIAEVDATTGMLGQGLSIGLGMALAKRANNDDNRVYVVVGDGELHEGQIWEAAQQAASYKLSNLVLLVDYNGLSSAGPVNSTINLYSLKDKFEAFEFNVIEIDGNKMSEVIKALEAARTNENKPLCIIAHTIKGKGISYMENVPKWHSNPISDEEREIAKNDLDKIEEVLLA